MDERILQSPPYIVYQIKLPNVLVSICHHKYLSQLFPLHLNSYVMVYGHNKCFNSSSAAASLYVRI